MSGLKEEEKEAFVNAVMDKIEEFYFNEEAEDSGQKLFFEFASKHDGKFPEDCNAFE